MKYLVYFETLEKYYRCLFDDGKYETLKDLPYKKERSHFECFKGFEATDDGLMEFKTKLIQWNNELKDNGILTIDWFKYYNNFSAVEMTFKRLCKDKYEHFEPIDKIEAKWIESTHNGGLTYCSAGTHQSFGFDYSGFYPTIMGQYKFIMPFSKGKEEYLKEIPDTIQLGFYRVKITSTNKNATKLFSFSPKHTYTNISLNHALELKDEFNFNIELIIDDKPNAYIYPKGIRGSNVFGTWVHKLGQIKAKYPKNKLIKHLMSSLWGSLSRSNNITRTYEEIQAQNIKACISNDSNYKIIDMVWNNEKEYYLLQDMNNPYKYNFRLKAFLTSFGRMKIAEVAMNNVDSVVRIQTDGIVFNKKVNLSISGLIPEDKTTGLIEWRNVNRYDKLS